MRLLYNYVIKLHSLRWFTACFAKVADIYFLVDSSGSIGQSKFDEMKSFIKQTVDIFDIGPTFTRIGVITFSEGAVMQFNLTTYTSKAEINTAIDNIPYTAGSTNTGKLPLNVTHGFECP